MTSRLAVIAVLLLSSTPAWGQQSSPPFGDTIVVTATGDTGSSDQIGAATTVIDAAQLQASGAANLAELLRRVPGAELLRSGLEGGVSTLFVRGTSSTQTLVLFDGVRLNSPFFGGYDWSLPLTTGIGRVEIVRGPYSALYGSDALGGVVQIFPARASDSRVRLFAEGGAEGWRRSELEALVRAGAWSVTVAGGARDGSGSLANDDFRSRAGLVDASYEVAPGTRAGVLFHRLTLFTGIPFSGPRVTPHRSTSEDETVAAIPIHVALRPGSEFELALSRVERTVGFRDPDDPQGFTRADTQANSDGIRAALHQTLGRHRIVAGGEWRRDEVTDGSSLGPNLDRRLLATRSLFAQDTLALGDHFGVLAGLRWDAADPWGRELSPRATLSWQGTAVRAWLSYGRAFRAPSLGELYYPYSGNPSLRPERAHSSEVGVAIPIGRDASRLELVAFSNRISDLIDFDFAAYRYGNIARAAQDGLEAWWTQAIAREGRLRLALTWLNARDGAGRPLLRRARWTGSATFDSPLLGPASGELSLIWVGPRVDLDPVTFSRVPQGGFVTADVALRAPLTPWLTARVRAENLAGRAYQEVRGYPAPGRRVMLGIETVLH